LLYHRKEKNVIGRNYINDCNYHFIL